MRVAIAVVILAVAFPLNGCCRPQQAVYTKPSGRVGVNPQSPRPPKLIKASSVRPPQPVTKPPQPTSASSVKPRRAVSTVSEPTKASSGKPPQPVSSVESPPPPPQRKPEQPPTSFPSREDSNTVERETEAKFKAAQAKAKRDGVDSLTREDIDGLSAEQLKELRGY
jgi:hypothetical protein